MWKQIFIAIIALLVGEMLMPVMANASSCPPIDKTKLDTDGVPFCPALTRSNTWGVTSCSFNAATKWRTFTKDEATKMTSLVQALKDEKAAEILSLTDALRMQVCRSKDGDDSFLLAYSKPGIKDFSGPFIMYREGGKTSQMVIQSPHDRTDNTHLSTKLAFVKSNALALLSNGHYKCATCKDGNRNSDWAHAKLDLGWVAFMAFKDIFPESVHVHLHGMKNYGLLATDSCGWKDAKHELRTAFMDAFKKAAGPERLKNMVEVKPWNFSGWTPGIPLTTDAAGKRADLKRWVGAEIGVKLHNGDAPVVVGTILNLEADYLKKPRGWVVEPPIPPEPPYLYAPVKTPKQGTPRLACLGIKYQDTAKFTDTAKCVTIAKSVADFFKTNSRGLMSIQPSGFSDPVALDGNAKNLAAAEKAVMALHPGFDLYAIIGMFMSSSHAAGKVAHLDGELLRDSQHEVGHLLGLQHAAIFKLVDGKMTIDEYGDSQSVMSRMPSGLLTAPQYYDRGWLREDEVALYQPGKVYELRRIDAFDSKDGLAAVIVKNEHFKTRPEMVGASIIDKDKNGATVAKRDAYLSFPINCQDGSCIALHLSNGSGSHKIRQFGEELYDTEFTGMHVKVLGFVEGKMKITIDFEAPPAVTK